MAFKTLMGRPVPARRPDCYVIYKRRTNTVVGMWGDAVYRNTVIRSMEQSFPGQYGSTEVWARLEADCTLEVQFGVIGLMLPECYRQEFERMLRSKVVAPFTGATFAKHRDAGAGFAPEGARECTGVLDRVNDQQGAHPASEARQNEV